MKRRMQPWMRAVSGGAPRGPAPTTNPNVIAGMRRWLPLAFLEGYLWFTVSLYWLGPFRYPLQREWPFLCYVAAAHAALLVGYGMAIRRYRPMPGRQEISQKSLYAVLAIGALWIAPQLALRLGPTGTSVSALVANATAAIDHPGEVYADFHLQQGDDSDPWLGRLSIALAPITYAALPLGLFYWRRLVVAGKVTVALIATADLVGWLARGTNKGIFDLALVFPWVILAATLSERTPSRLVRPFVTVVLCAVTLLAAFSLFSRGYLERKRATWDQTMGVRVDDSRPLMLATPVALQPLVVATTSYLTQGYYMLGLALEEPFVPCYGLGNSFFLQGLLRRWPAAERAAALSYPGRLEQVYGFDRMVKWHTFYVWVASDLTFPGVILFVALVGWLLGTVWLDSLTTRHPYAVVLLPLLVTMVLYFPANNQVFGFSVPATAFVTVSFLWWRWRRRSVPPDPRLGGPRRSRQWQLGGRRS